jgi:hypothetical protein
LEELFGKGYGLGEGKIDENEVDAQIFEARSEILAQRKGVHVMNSSEGSVLFNKTVPQGSQRFTQVIRRKTQSTFDRVKTMIKNKFNIYKQENSYKVIRLRDLYSKGAKPTAAVPSDPEELRLRIREYRRQKKPQNCFHVQKVFIKKIKGQANWRKMQQSQEQEELCAIKATEKKIRWLGKRYGDVSEANLHEETHASEKASFNTIQLYRKKFFAAENPFRGKTYRSDLHF